jgi:hypothetical protein
MEPAHESGENAAAFVPWGGVIVKARNREREAKSNA